MVERHPVVVITANIQRVLHVSLVVGLEDFSVQVSPKHGAEGVGPTGAQHETYRGSSGEPHAAEGSLVNSGINNSKCEAREDGTDVRKRLLESDLVSKDVELGVVEVLGVMEESFDVHNGLPNQIIN